VVAVLVGSLLAIRAGRQDPPDDPAAAGADASGTTTPAAGADAASETTPVADQVVGYPGSPDPCDALPRAMTRRYAPHAVPVPDIRPSDDPLDARRCRWLGLEQTEDGMVVRSRELRLTFQAFPDTSEADVRFDTITYNMANDIDATQQLIGERALDGFGEAAHLRTIHQQDPLNPSTATSLVMRESNLVMLIEYFGNEVRHEPDGTGTTSQAMDERTTERVITAVAEKAVARLPDPGDLASNPPRPSSGTAHVYRHPPKPCASLRPEIVDRMVPAADKFDYDEPELAGQIDPQPGTEERVCKWSNDRLDIEGERPSPDATHELTLTFTVFTGEGQGAVDNAIARFGGWDISQAFGSGTVNRFRRLPRLGDEAFVIAGHKTSTLDSTDAYAALRSGNLVITVDYSGWDIPGGAPAREFESAAVEVAADVARQATR
jgi:hypothetical protein